MTSLIIGTPLLVPLFVNHMKHSVLMFDRTSLKKCTSFYKPGCWAWTCRSLPQYLWWKVTQAAPGLQLLFPCVRFLKASTTPGSRPSLSCCRRKHFTHFLSGPRYCGVFYAWNQNQIHLTLHLQNRRMTENWLYGHLHANPGYDQISRRVSTLVRKFESAWSGGAEN